MKTKTCVPVYLAPELKVLNVCVEVGFAISTEQVPDLPEVDPWNYNSRTDQNE